MYFLENRADHAKDYDRKVLVKWLIKTCETNDNKVVKAYVKEVVSDKAKLDFVIEETKYDLDELFYHFVGLFPELFNKNLIKKIKKELKSTVDDE